MMRVACALLVLGCQTAAEPAAPAPEPTAPTEDDLPFDGRIEPTNATELHAPQNTFRIAGWSSDSGWIKLTELVAEGTEVAADAVVARFEFNGKRALPRIKEQIDRTKAEQKESAIDLEGELRDLRVEKDKRVLAAERARLDTLRGDAISKRQLALFRIEHEIARFEAEAVRQRLAAQRRRMASEAAWHAREVERAVGQQTRFDAYEVRFELRAPHAGVVRYAFLPMERRKVQKGDGVPAGRHVVSVARDERLSVRFYVPEHRCDDIAVGDVVQVRSVAADDRFPATVRRIELFPQELGFLREDDKLPNAREKAFAVVADLGEAVGALTAGNEVQVVRP